MSVDSSKKFNTAHQEISKYIFLVISCLSFISLVWFGVNQTLGFWQDFTDLIFALVLGIIPLRHLGNIRTVLFVLFIGGLWITSKVISLFYSYQQAIARDPECGIKCMMSDPLVFSSIFIIILIMIYLYKPVTEKIKIFWQE